MFNISLASLHALGLSVEINQHSEQLEFRHNGERDLHTAHLAEVIYKALPDLPERQREVVIEVAILETNKQLLLSVITTS